MAAEISCEQLGDVNNKLSYEVAIEVIGPSSEAAAPSEIALKSIQIKIAEATAPKAQSLIYKVHKPLRDVNEKAYAPQIISIGPYHRGKENLKLMEEHKRRYLRQLILRKPNAEVADYIAAVAQVEQMARDGYAEPVDHISPAEFIEMLVLDGCFIIELLRKDVSKYLVAENDPIFQTLWIQNSLKRDMILLENQIPFFVLCKLFDLIEAPNRLYQLIRLVEHFFRPLYPGYLGKLRHVSSSEDVKHILDLLHRDWSPLSSGEDHHVHLIPEETRFIKSATELRNANVEFRMLSDAMLNVDFENGTLSIPLITIKDSTECILRNLIAYEQYFPIGQPTPFTDYAVLLNCLVNTPADVKLLSEIGIFKNKLEDNEAVANIFNRIPHSVTLCQLFLYENTFTRINDHYQKRRSRFHEKKNRAFAKLKQDYNFDSPWAYISFFAAFLLLLLTTAQTVFSAMQSLSRRT